MKKIFLTILINLLSTIAFSQAETDAEIQAKMDSVEKSFTYEYGTIHLKNDIGQVVIPEGFKYLNAEQAERVIVDFWGNPRSENLTLGLILPKSQGIMNENGYAFNIQYDAIGHVKDDDAGDINYEELLQEMQKDANEENKKREKEGYPAIKIMGWAAKPFYDKEKKILHWAKEIQFAGQESNILNYNIRILGRKGVLVLNAIATMPNFASVQKDIPQIAGIVQFSAGNTYKDFNPSVDQVATWTIGGLVAGKVLAKVGFFAMLLKFWKIIAVAVAGAFGLVWKKMRGAKEEPASKPVMQTETKTESEV